MPCILVIEDNAPIRALMRLILERAGYEVVEAREGREGLQVCHIHPVDLVLTDLMMPGLDGVATIRAVRALRPTLKIIVISGRDVRRDPSIVALVARREIHGILVKPVPRQELLAAVQEALMAPDAQRGLSLGLTEDDTRAQWTVGVALGGA